MPLLPELEKQLRTAMVQANRRSVRHHGRRGRPRRRPGLLAAAGLLVLAGAAAAATQVIDIGEPVESQLPGAELRVQPKSAMLTSLRVADPRSGPPWGLQLFRDRAGHPCAQAGRIVEGKLGVVGSDGKFHVAPAGNRPFSCGARSGTSYAESRLYGTIAEAGRRVHWGLVGTDVSRLELNAGNSRRRRVPIDPSGAFVVVLPGATAHITLSAQLADGSNVTGSPRALVARLDDEHRPTSVSPHVRPRSGATSARFVVSFRAADDTGESGVFERHYVVKANGPRKVGCVVQREVIAHPARVSDRVEVLLRAAGGGEGTRWCRGNFRGTVTLTQAPLCEPSPCSVRPQGRSTRSIVGRFDFVVR